MPHLHLPAAHDEVDLALAADLAELLGSADLFVTWTHAEGPGAAPEVIAEIRELPPERPGLVGALLRALAGLWAFVSRAPGVPMRVREPHEPSPRELAS